MKRYERLLKKAHKLTQERVKEIRKMTPMPVGMSNKDAEWLYLYWLDDQNKWGVRDDWESFRIWLNEEI